MGTVDSPSLQALLIKRSFCPSVDDSQNLGKADSGPRVRMRNVAAYSRGKSFSYQSWLIKIDEIEKNRCN